MAVGPSLEISEENTGFFSRRDLSILDKDKLPRHVAIIMDGNRRWAQKRNLPPAAGHWAGIDVLMNTMEAARELGIKAVTVYAFSTENWNRSQEEIKILMEIFETALVRNSEAMIRNGIRLHSIGNIKPFPVSFLKIFKKIQENTSQCKNVDLILALNYGGRNEICRAVTALIEDYENKKFKKEKIDERLLESYLDTAQWKDPDLLIRTSGEQRLSNFLLWQISYTEVYITDVLWPDFSPRDLLKALMDYQQRNRRLGGL